MKRTKLTFAALLVALNSQGFCGTMGSPELWTQVVTLSMGPSWTTSAVAQTIRLLPDFVRTYTANSVPSFLTGEFFYGWQRVISQIWTGQIGFEGALTSNMHFHGDVWEDGLPQFTASTYSYHVNHKHLALKGKLLANVGEYVQPYISASIGVGWNNAHNYQLTRLDPLLAPPPNYDDHTTTTFVYTLGVGLEKALAENWQGGIGYEFAGLGKSKLDPFPGQVLGSGLATKQINTNTLLFSISYLG